MPIFKPIMTKSILTKTFQNKRKKTCSSHQLNSFCDIIEMQSFNNWNDCKLKNILLINHQKHQQAALDRTRTNPRSFSKHPKVVLTFCCCLKSAYLFKRHYPLSRSISGFKEYPNEELQLSCTGESLFSITDLRCRQETIVWQAKETKNQLLF